MSTMKQIGMGAAIVGMLVSASTVMAQEIPADANNFYKSNSVNMQAVTFKNQYKMDIGGSLFLPNNLNQNEKYPVIIVGHPMGAVKEQSSSLYATKMAEQGFVTLAVDLAFWGDSAGEPRNAVSPEMYAETFSAAADYLGARPYVDKAKIGVIGICGSGSFAISAAKIDPRLKAIATISMYDMGTASRDGLRKGVSLEQRKQFIAQAVAQREVEFAGGETQYTGGTVHELTAQSNPIEREFYEFYRTARGEFTPKGTTPLLTTRPTLSSNIKFMNFYPFNDMETISPRPMLFIAGANAHSIEFSEEAYRIAAEPKELLLVPNAGHVDLYDRVNLIPFAKLTEFFKNNLK